MPEIQEVQPQAQQQSAPVTEQVNNFLSDFSQFLPQNKIDELTAAAGTAPAPQAPPAEQQPASPEVPAPEGDQPAQNEPAQQAAPANEPDKNQAPAQQADQKKNIFGIGKNAGKTTPIEKPEDLLDAVKKSFGQEYKSISEMPKFLETAQGWRKNAEKLKTVEEEYGKMKEDLMKLPEEFFHAFQKLAAGEDYTQPFLQKKAIDFNVPAEKQDIKKLVNHYFPDKFTDEDFTDAEGEKSKGLEIAEQAAKDRFVTEKGVYDNQRAQTAQQAKQKAEAQKAAVMGSVDTLRQRFPDMDDDVVNEARSIMEGGAQKILSLFLDKNGAVTPQAAIRVVMALHGETDLLPHAMEVAASKAESQVLEDLVSRGADSPKPTRTGSQPAEHLTKEQTEKINEWKNLGTSKSTY